MLIAYLIAGALAAAPVTDLDPAPPSDFAGLVAVMTEGRPEARAALDRLAVDMLKTGEVEPGWNANAFDFAGWLERQGANASSHVLYDDSDGMRAITSLDGPFDIQPLPYRYAIIGDVDAAGDQEQSLQRLGEGIYLNYRGDGALNGSAMCSVDGAAEIMATRPPGDWSSADWQMVLAVGAFVEQAQARAICTVYGESAQGRLTERFYTKEGASYELLNDAAAPWRLRPRVEALQDFFAD